jgi:hypothetical protein
MAPLRRLIVATEQAAPASASPACAVPDGTAHAFDPETGQTQCGLAAVAVTSWPDLAWPPSGMAALDTCPACLAAG